MRVPDYRYIRKAHTVADRLGCLVQAQGGVVVV